MKGIKNLRMRVVAVLILLLLLIIMAHQSYAVPAFARKYSMSCTTCHAPIPRLKAFGDDFAGNGFELENQEASRYTMKTGDDNLELIRTFPMAARFDGYIKYQSETNKEVDFTAPYNLKLVSGGRLAKNIAYYFYFFMSERGEVAGVEDAYIMFNNLFGQDLDVYVGQFQVSDPLFKREVRLTYEDYMIYKYNYGESGINLTYDRGVMITYGIENGPDIIVELLNGNGIGEADESHTYDDDKYKTFAGRVSYDVGEYVRVGAFGYYGKERKSVSGIAANEVTYWGPDMTLSNGQLELNLQYMMRTDDNPNFLQQPPDDEIKINGGLAEFIYWPKGDQSKWYLVGLYNHIDLDRGGLIGKYTEYQTISAHVGHVLQTNLRLVLEGTYDIEMEEGRVVLGFVSGF